MKIYTYTILCVLLYNSRAFVIKPGEKSLFYRPVLYDTVIKNGTICDTEGKSLYVADIGISNGIIIEINANIPPEQGIEVIVANDLYVTPGLIDLHTHAYWGSTYWGINPDPVAAITGVTTWVDAGSAGAYNFPAFRKNVIEKSQVRIFSFLHISGIGLTARTFESAIDEFLDEEMANVTIFNNRDVIKGIKVRVDRDATNGTGTLGLMRARSVSKATGLPLMIHIGISPPSLEDILPLLEEGDILTHSFTGHSNKLVDDEGNPLPIVNSLMEKGIFLDIGHGSGSFSYKSAEGLINNGILPDVISSDIHQVSRLGPMYDLPTTISKMINLGVRLIDAISMATIVPARIIGEENLGALKIGGPADIAIFNLEIGNFTFEDSSGIERNGNFRLVNKLTMVKGKILAKEKEDPPHPWVIRDLEDIIGPD